MRKIEKFPLAIILTATTLVRKTNIYQTIVAKSKLFNKKFNYFLKTCQYLPKLK